MQEWYAAQDDKVRASFDFTLYQRRVTDDWINPNPKSARKQFKTLDREHLGLAELRFGCEDGRDFRVAGLYRPDQREFVLFTGLAKKWRGLIQEPPDAFDVAMKYKKQFEVGIGELRERI